jgi:hypothetical protein
MKMYFILIVSIICIVLFSAFVNTNASAIIFENEGNDSTKNKMPKVVENYTPCLGAQLKSGTYTVKDILAIVGQKISATNDKTKEQFKVNKYDFTYSEHNLYEDSTGLPVILTDVHFAELTGDSITTYWQKFLRNHLYKGDTVRFSGIIINQKNTRLKIPNKLVLIAK